MQLQAGGKKTFNEESKYKRKDVLEPELSALAAASRVHGSMEVLQSVLLLLPPSLVFLVLFIAVIISGQLIAAQGARICLT